VPFSRLGFTSERVRRKLGKNVDERGHSSLRASCMSFQYTICSGSITAFRVGSRQSKTRVLGNRDIIDGKMQVGKHSCEVKYSSPLHSQRLDNSHKVMSSFIC